MSLTASLPVSKPPSWQILRTPPMSGPENMAFDLETLRRLQSENHPPRLRFFTWSRPTVSYGKHQTLEKIRSLIPEGWETVQRPTGGGLVSHGKDLCLSLAWRHGQPPLSLRLRDHYGWIHSVIRDALEPLMQARLANCHDCSAASSFATRDCFTEPVAHDVLAGPRKIVGGAMCRQKDTVLYQGSVQGIDAPDLEQRLRTAFESALQIA